MNFDLMKGFMDRLTAWRIPGNSISVYIDNREVFSYQSGYENFEKKIKMGNDKLFNIYSCSKIATVTAALQLYEQGFFLLDDPLYEFIPEYKEMHIVDKEGNIRKAQKPITLRHLFTMTSGLTYNQNTPAYDKARMLTDGKMNTITVAKCIAEDPLSFEAGERWQYSVSHDVLAAVVEVVSGKKFRDYVKDSIFTPLDMNESYYHSDNVLARVCEQYKYVNSDEVDNVKLQQGVFSDSEGFLENVGKTVQSQVWGSEYDSGGAGITTSVSDYSTFLSALANGGVGKNGERIISSGTIELLRTNQLNESQSKSFNWQQHKGYGYGLGVRTMISTSESGSPGSIGEFGWGGAAGATAIVDPKLRLSVFYAHHMLNPQEMYYQPRLRNVLYACL